MDRGEGVPGQNLDGQTQEGAVCSCSQQVLVQSRREPAGAVAVVAPTNFNLARSIQRLHTFARRSVRDMGRESNCKQRAVAPCMALENRELYLPPTAAAGPPAGRDARPPLPALLAHLAPPPPPPLGARGIPPRLQLVVRIVAALVLSCGRGRGRRRWMVHRWAGCRYERADGRADRRTGGPTDGRTSAPCSWRSPNSPRGSPRRHPHHQQMPRGPGRQCRSCTGHPQRRPRSQSRTLGGPWPGASAATAAATPRSPCTPAPRRTSPRRPVPPRPPRPYPPRCPVRCHRARSPYRPRSAPASRATRTRATATRGAARSLRGRVWVWGWRGGTSGGTVTTAHMPVAPADSVGGTGCRFTLSFEGPVERGLVGHLSDHL